MIDQKKGYGGEDRQEDTDNFSLPPLPPLPSANDGPPKIVDEPNEMPSLDEISITPTSQPDELPETEPDEEVDGEFTIEEVDNEESVEEGLFKEKDRIPLNRPKNRPQSRPTTESSNYPTDNQNGNKGANLDNNGVSDNSGESDDGLAHPPSRPKNRPKNRPQSPPDTPTPQPDTPPIKQVSSDFVSSFDEQRRSVNDNIDEQQLADTKPKKKHGKKHSGKGVLSSLLQRRKAIGQMISTFLVTLSKTMRAFPVIRRFAPLVRLLSKIIDKIWDIVLVVIIMLFFLPSILGFGTNASGDIKVTDELTVSQAVNENGQLKATLRNMGETSDTFAVNAEVKQGMFGKTLCESPLVRLSPKKAERITFTCHEKLTKPVRKVKLERANIE